jgi:hypothetical protein
LKELFGSAFLKALFARASEAPPKADCQQLQKSPLPISRRGLITATMTICR